MTGDYSCPSCGVASAPDAKFCEFCGATLHSPSTSVDEPSTLSPQAIVDAALGIFPRIEDPASRTMLQGRADLTISRYREGYHYAGIIHALGTFIQVITGIVGGLLALIGLFGILGSTQENPLGQLAVAGSASSLVTGLVIGVIGYIHGVLVKAVGYFLKAQCDCAVNGSHFLNDDQRAQVMSLE